MASPRAYWKGFLRLSLVTIPVNLYNAVETRSEISFRQIHKPSGRRINYVKMVEGVGKIENSDIAKGYEVDKDRYVILESEEIEAVKLESKKTIDLVEFVDTADIDHRYFERPYYLAPADKVAAEGYVVIRDALRTSGKVGLAQLTINGREWLVAVGPLQDGLVMEMLRYADELRDPADYFGDVPKTKPAKELTDLALQLIDQKSRSFDPSRFTDHYGEALRALVQEKMRGHTITAKAEERPSGSNVVDLMDALRKSIERKPAEKAKEPKAKSSSGSTAPKRTGKRKAG